MKVVILAGGLGSRLSEETVSKPKPMVEISNKPIIWHIMNIYSYYGFNEFIICCGYKGHIIKEYFLNYSLYNSNVEIDLETNKLLMLKNQTEKWKIKLIDTGKKSNTGGRIKRIEEYLTKSEPFFLTEFCLYFSPLMTREHFSQPLPLLVRDTIVACHSCL